MADGDSQNAVVACLAAIWNTLWEIWLEPLFMAIGLYEPPDRTYGRATVPFSKMEERLHNNPDITCSFHKVMMPNGKDWVWYQVWEDKLAQRATGRIADMVFCHGTGVHSGTLASHSRRYLDAGYRLVVPDLPSHGYSTGLHVYQPRMRGYTEGIRQVIHDVARRDDEVAGTKTPKQQRKKTFLLGLSFGGLVALLYGLYYPASLREDTTDMNEIPVDGLVGVGPIVNYNERDVQVGMIKTIMLHVLGVLAGRLEMFVPHKKVVDKDPKVYKQLIDTDLRSHRGAFRAGHFLCIKMGYTDLQRNAGKIQHPIYVQHGLQDRVVTVEASMHFLRRVHSKDIAMTVYPVCQHVVYRKSKSEVEDLAGRVSVIEDNIEWMNARCPGSGHIERGVSFSSDLGDMDSKSAIDGFMSGAATPNEPQTNGVVSQTLHSISDQLDTAINQAAASSGVQVPVSTVVNRHEKRVPRPRAKPPLEKDEDGWQEERVYKENWTLPEDLRPYDVLF